jgi:glutathione S-transferase
MLQELGVAYEHSTVAPWSDEIKLYHPMGKVPALVVDDTFSLYESAAINTYLGDAFSARKKLVPSCPSHERAKYDQTILYIMTEIDAQALWIHRKHAALGKVFGDIPEAVQAAKTQFTKANRSLSHQLKPYLLGEEFSAADILYVHCLNWAIAIGWDDTWEGDDGMATRLVEYLSRCRSRPAYQETIRIQDEERERQKKKSYI